MFQGREPLLDAQHNTNSARMIEFQRLLTPMLRAEWCVFHAPAMSTVITNDRGWTGVHFVGDRGPLSYAFPLSHSAVLGLRQGTSAPTLDFDSGIVSGVTHVQLDAAAVSRLNQSLAATALQEIYGPDPRELLSVGEFSVGAVPEAVVLTGAEGLVPSTLDLRMHEFEWMGLVGQLRAATNRLPSLNGAPWIIGLNLPKPAAAARALAQFALEGVEKALEAHAGEEALNELRTALEEDPSGVSAWIERRRALSHFGRPDRDSRQVARARSEAVASDPTRSSSERLLAAIEFALIDADVNVPGAARDCLDLAASLAADPSRTRITAGLLMQAYGDVAGAMAMYRHTSHSDSDSAADGLVHAGLLAWRERDLPEALAAFEEAYALGHPENSPMAAFHAGGVSEELGDLKGSKGWFEAAVASAHDAASPGAAAQLARLLWEGDDAERARELLEVAQDSHHVLWGPNAAFLLGQLLERSGDADGAVRHYTRASHSYLPLVAPHAAVKLGDLLLKRGDVDGAETSYKRALQWSDPDCAALAALGLVDVAEARGVAEDGEYWLMQATASPSQPIAALACWRLAFRRSAAGDVPAAIDLLGRVIAISSPNSAPYAAGYLALLHYLRGELDEAAAAARTAVATGNPAVAAKAAVLLGQVLNHAGDRDGARAAYRQAIDSRLPRHGGLALCNLAVLEADAGNHGISDEYLQTALAIPGIAHDFSCLILAEREARHGDHKRARELYDQALLSSDRGLRAEAALEMGQLLAWDGDAESAERLLRRSVAEKVEVASSEAQRLIASASDAEAAREWLLSERSGSVPLGLDATAEEIDASYSELTSSQVSSIGSRDEKNT